MRELLLVVLTAHLVPMSMMWLGQACHILKTVVELRDRGEQIGLGGFVRSRPYKTALGLLGGLAGYLLLYDTNQLTLVAAFGVGYMADSVLDAVGRTTQRRLEQ